MAPLLQLCSSHMNYIVTVISFVRQKFHLHFILISNRLNEICIKINQILLCNDNSSALRLAFGNFSKNYFVSVFHPIIKADVILLCV